MGIRYSYFDHWFLHHLATSSSIQLISSKERSTTSWKILPTTERLITTEFLTSSDPCSIIMRKRKIVDYGSGIRNCYRFAIDTTKPTIYAKPAFTQYQGSMEAPRASFYDTLLINKLYKCTGQRQRTSSGILIRSISDKCQNKITCQNNGVQDGADCNKCFCPKGWAGTNCDMRVRNT